MNVELRLGRVGANESGELGCEGLVACFIAALRTALLCCNYVPLIGEKRLLKRDHNTRLVAVDLKFVSRLAREHIAVVAVERAAADIKVYNLPILAVRACDTVKVAGSILAKAISNKENFH